MRTEATLNALAAELQQNCGDMLAACRTVGVSLIFVNQWRKDDSIVNDRLLEAERVGTQGLVSEAIRRGVHGVTEDIWYKGESVGKKKVYSDGLLTTLLKAKIPEFSASDGGSTNVNVNVLANVMPRADNYEAWLAMKQATIAPPPEKLEHHQTVEDAEYEEISDAAKVAHKIMKNPLKGISL